MTIKPAGHSDQRTKTLHGIKALTLIWVMATAAAVTGCKSQQEAENSEELWLCNINNPYVSFSYKCTTIKLSDGTNIKIGKDSAARILIESVDGLRSGKIPSQFGKPLSPEESSHEMLNAFMG